MSITNLDSGYLTETSKVVIPATRGGTLPTILNCILSPPSVKSLLRIKQSPLISVMTVPYERISSSPIALISIPTKSLTSNPSTRGSKLKSQTLLLTALVLFSKATVPLKS